jgi:tRNA pseudouridine38-40 synthase
MGPDELRRALNAILPGDIRVLASEEAPDGFHARFSARAKTYHYRILLGGIVSPFERGYLWAVAPPLDLEAMRAAAASLEGCHDFASFQAAGSDVRETVRTISRSRWHAGIPDQDMPGQMLVYEITGDGFLRHMVRAIVGTLVDVGYGRRTVGSVRDLLTARDRTLAGPTAPAHGLFLASVDYGTMSNSFRKPDVARTAICLDSARLAR